MTGSINISEREFRFGVVKIAILLTFLVVALGLVASVLADRFQSIALNSFLFCLAFFMVSNGVLGVLQTIDWFEARKAKSNG